MQADPNRIEPEKYAFTFKADGDYSFLLVDVNAKSYPLTLKLHNGRIEAETSEGIIVNPTIK